MADGLVVNIKKRWSNFSLEASFSVSGGYLGLLGASGSGKSMTLKCIAGVLVPDEGSIVSNGRTLFDSAKGVNLPPQKRNIGYLFQSYALFPHLTVMENICLGLNQANQEKALKTSDILQVFHLEGLEQKYPDKLSGGQQQRVALARSIIYQPDVLLLDEPFSALDTHLRDLLQIELMELLRLYTGEVLLVTHSRDEVYRICKNLVVMVDGKSVLSGNTQQIFQNPQWVSVAQLTGCKNISPCEILADYKLRALAWDLTLETDIKIPNQTKFVGIRAHDLYPLVLDHQISTPNIMPCVINQVVEDLFEHNVLLHNGIHYKVKKTDWANIKHKNHLCLKVPKQAILLLQ